MYGQEIPEDIGGEGREKCGGKRTGKGIRFCGGENTGGEDDIFSQEEGAEKHETIPVFWLYVLDELSQKCFHASDSTTIRTNLPISGILRCVWEFQEIFYLTSMSHPNREIIERIITAAHEAPSGDNMRPWKFQVFGDRIEISFEEKEFMDNIVYSIAPILPGNMISLGALVENIGIAASAERLHIEIESVSDAGAVTARLRLVDSGRAADPFVPILPIRRTDRRPFRQDPLESEALAKAESWAKLFGGRIVWVEGSAERRRFAGLAESFERVLWHNPILRRYISSSFRFGSDAKEGITLAHMGLGWRRFFFPAFFGLTRYIPMLFVFMGLFSGWNMKALIRKSAAVGALILEKPCEQRLTYFDGGRALERLWLSLNADGIALQPIYGLAGIVLNQRLKVGGFSGKETVWQEDSVHELQELFPGLEHGTPVIFFRVGRSVSPPLPSVPHRPPYILWN